MAHVSMQKYYVYDPALHPGDEIGGLRILADNEQGDGLHVLAPHPMIQYWIDQGLAGREPLDKLSGSAKAMLAQATRGRSESDDEPKRVARLSKLVQSGAPTFAFAQSPRKVAKSKSRGKSNRARDTQDISNKDTTTKPQENKPPLTRPTTPPPPTA